MRRIGLAFSVILFAAASALADPPANYEREIQPYLAKYCYSCHSGPKKKAKLNFEKFHSATEAAAAKQLWPTVVTRVKTKEMPPAESPQPTDAERAMFLAWAEYHAKPPAETDCTKIANDQNTNFYRGHVMSRRITRYEYACSIRDLTGVELPVAEFLPADGAGGEGFDTTGDTLFLSAIHLEKYLDAAERVITAAYANPQSRSKLLPPMPGVPTRNAAEQIIATFARRAYRRPVSESDMNRLMGLFERATARGDGLETALRLPFKSILISPNFLFLAEPVPAKEGVSPLDVYALASRLSYFLWSSIPDEELLRLAGENKLQNDAILKAQVRRMLRDPKAKAIGENFGLQWLGLNSLGNTTRPDAKRFPEFNDALASDMRTEAAQVVASLFRENRSLLELIDADSTFANERLSKYYGIPGVSGPEIRRVALTDRNRGGVLGLGAVLTATSYPLRTSPVLRGKWLLEEVLGSKVPPPPPGAGDLPQDDHQADKLTFRQRLEQHRTKPECASCHARMDPLGFGLENFDAIGRWRTEQNGQPIDSTGTLPSGEKFASPAELKAILLKRKGEFLRHFSRKLYGYAMGRALDKYDNCVIDDCVKNLEENRYDAAMLVERIVLSFPFRHRYYKQ